MLGLAGLLFLSAIGLNVLAYRHAYAMMHFTSGTPRTGLPEQLGVEQKIRVLFSGVQIPRPQSPLAPGSLSPSCKSVKIDSTNGIKLGAWFCPGSNQAPLVIFFHGYSSEKTSLVAEAKQFLEMGSAVLLVDFRGSGESSESYTTVGYAEAEDVAAAMRYAREQIKPSKVILYGQSMGAAAILRAIHACEVRPDAIILEAVFDNMLNTVRHRFEAMKVPAFPAAQLLLYWGGRQAGFNGFEHNPAEYARSVRCPALFLHGTADPRAKIEEGRRVYDAIVSPKHFQEFPGVGHAPSLQRFPKEWSSTVKNFLAKAHFPSPL